MPLRISQLTLLSSLTLYPLLFRLFTGPRPTPSRYTASLKATSTLHSLLTTFLALSFLRVQQRQWPSRLHTSPPHSDKPILNARSANLDLDGDTNPTLTQRSEFGNAITALEAGYLFQDTFALLLQARLFSFPKPRTGVQQRIRTSVLDKTLLTHHLLIGTALFILQFYIARNRELGIYIIVQFVLMNASTPFLHLRWFIRNILAKRGTVLLAGDVLFAAAFCVARIGLVWKILGDYGAWHGWGVWETFCKGLRTPCQMGTGALLVANAGWWVSMVWTLVKRNEQFTFGGH